MPAVPVLPPELCDRIIDYLHSSTKSLTACALVCHSWLPTARYHLFRDTLITPRTASAFDALVSASPSLGQAVSTLELSNLDWRSSRWLREPTSFLAYLPAVSSLTLSGFLVTGSIYTALLHNLASVTKLDLVRCCFDSHADFLALLRSFPLLDALSCGDLLFLHSCTELDDAPPPALRTLEITSTEWHLQVLSPFLDWWIASPSYTALQTLAFRIESTYHAMQLNRLLNVLGGTLRELRLTVDTDTSLDRVLGDADFTLAPCTVLTTCTLAFHLREMCVPENTALRFIPLLLAQLSAPTLARISLTLFVDDMQDLRALDSECGVRPLTMARFGEMRALDWAAVQAALASGQFDGLRSFEVYGKGEPRFLEEELRRTCPELAACEALAFVSLC